MRRLDITRSLRGEQIFITGATGFLGKVLVEKLLWSVPEVGKLLLLVRPRRDRSAADRVREELLGSPAMARLRALHGDDWQAWAASKVEVVPGDLGRNRFGLDDERYAALCTRVERVVASAATVTFDERLDRALELNARGALRTLALARDAGGAPLLHVSTCFVSGRRQGPVPERVATAESTAGGELDPDALLRELDEVSRKVGAATDLDGPLVAAGAEVARKHGFQDVYTLTKSLGERLLERHRGRVPVAILRPAIVESALAEPIPGWIDAIRVTDPLLVAYGRGRSREFAGSADAPLEIVPVDHVVNALIAAMADLARTPAAEPAAESSAEIPVYQLGSSRNPVTLGELLDHAREGFAKSPLRDERGRPIRVAGARFVDPRRYRRKLLARRARVRRLARWLRSTPLGARLSRAERALDHFVRLLAVYSPYLEHGARYRDEATRRLWGRLSPAAREAFPFDVEAVDWRSYIAGIHVPGLVRFALRAEDGRPSPPGKQDPLAELHARGEFPPARAQTLFELFEIAAEADPDAIAFQTCRGGRWLRYSYGQALTATANIAHRLASRHGIRPGDRVVLWGTGSPEWVLASFAVHRLGAVTVPLDPQWPEAEVAAAARLTGAKLICAAPMLAAQVRESSCPLAELATPFVPEPDVGLLPGAESPSRVGESHQPACIIFTSGTTVAPKAVPLTHANLLANVRDLVPVMRLSRERMLSVLPIHHVFEFTVGLLVPLAGGGTISYVEEIKPAEISWMMATTRPTMLVAVPRLLELLHNGIRQSVAAGGPALSLLFRVLFALSSLTGGRHGHLLFGKVHRRFGGSLRRIATGGSALEAALGKSFQLMGFRVAEGYGMTETSPVLTVNPWQAVRLGSVGKPLPGVEVELRQVAGAAPDCGEVWVRGANVMAGYYRNPQATGEVLRDGWLNTGDIGRFDADGYLHISGRTKDVIVTDAGKNVYPEEVELRYRGLPQVEELVVLGLPSGRGGDLVGAVIVPRADATEEEIEGIRTAIAERSAGLPSYQQITRLEIWSGELPKTTTLKVKRGLLREAVLSGERGRRPAAAQQRAPESTGPEAPHTEEQTRLLAVLARLIHTRPDLLQPGDRLSDLGVDSLTRVELLGEVEARLGVRLTEASVGTFGRVQDLLDLVAEAPPTSRPAAVHRPSPQPARLPLDQRASNRPR